jgi:hypothetical protein
VDVLKDVAVDQWITHVEGASKAKPAVR